MPTSARALTEQGKLDEAVAEFRQAIALKPNFADAHANLGVALRQLGQLSEARAALEQAVRLAPRNAKIPTRSGRNHAFRSGGPASEEHGTVGWRTAARFPSSNRIELHFALAKAYEDVGRHAEAFRQWLDGNALKRRQIVV